MAPGLIRDAAGTYRVVQKGWGEQLTVVEWGMLDKHSKGAPLHVPPELRAVYSIVKFVTVVLLSIVTVMLAVRGTVWTPDSETMLSSLIMLST